MRISDWSSDVCSSDLCLANGDPVLAPEQEEALARAVFDRIFQLGRLQPLIDDERIQNIIANGFDQVFLEYEDGTKVPGPPIASRNAELIEVLRAIGRRYGLSERGLNPSRPTLRSAEHTSELHSL